MKVSLNNLFVNNVNSKDKPEEGPNKKSLEEIIQYGTFEILDPTNYREEGREKCLTANGSDVVLRSCLDNNYQYFIELCRRDVELQKNYKVHIENMRREQESELRRKQTLRDIKANELDSLNKEIKEIDFKISDLPNNPEKYGIEARRKPKIQFYIGSIILIPMTIYLIVFYISASYSAFFKEFSPVTTVLAAIFDGQALVKAWNDPNGGVLELIFITTIPFAFMGLGYLIHMFLKTGKSSTFKVAAILALTFVFDVILAYLIEKKIFDFDKMPGDEFSMLIALQSVGFWGIIFAGFVVYVIWGFILDFVIKEYEDLDVIQGEIRRLNNEKEIKQRQKDELISMINNLRGEEAEITKKIEQLTQRLTHTFFNSASYLRNHTEFFSSWLLTITGEIAMATDRKEELLRKCTEVAEAHVNQIRNDNPNL